MAGRRVADTPRSLIDEWTARPENSARTVIVTIFGDTIVPVADSVWLGQLFQMTAPLGFSERLVRTSMFRLAADDWLTNERVGRQSRYALTDAARTESIEAARRIYHESYPSWTGDWTLAFADADHIGRDAQERLVEHLGWHGFVLVSRGVLASPEVTPERAAALCALAAPDVAVPIGRFAFHDLDAVVAEGFFDTNLDIATRAAAYEDFVAFHERAVPQASMATGAEAFALRTVLIHDLRRIALRGVDIPRQVLPKQWAGTEAHALARDLYATLSTVAAPWLSEVFDAAYPRVIPGRFDAPPA